MTHCSNIILPVLLAFHMFCYCQASLANQAQFFTLLKKSLTGNWSDWDENGGQHFCNYNGIACDDTGDVVMIDISNRSLSGEFPEDVCSYMPKMRILRIGYNNLQGKFPRSITNCTLLEELNVTSTILTGSLPDFSPLKSLRLLDFSYNNQIGGDFPMSFTNLSSLELIYFNEGDFNLWQLPSNISRLSNLKTMILISCRINGEIPESIGYMTSLVSLQLSGNFLQGKLPVELGELKNLKQLDLYYNQLQGQIPEELGNLTEIEEIDMSVNKFTKLPESIFHLPKLKFLQLYNNSLTGEIPASFGNSTTLVLLSLYENFLTGKIPPNLGKSSPLVGFDLSENQLSGELPAGACDGGKLMYFLVLGNMLSGEIPENYAKCEPLLRFRVSNNNLEGKIPEGMFGLPHMSILDVGYNHLNGSISNTIQNAKNMSELLMQNNMITGGIPPEISKAMNLVKIELYNNLLSGPIPSEIGNLKQLNSLLLEGNKLNSSIPSSLSSLKSLSLLDLSRNLLKGTIPESLSELLPSSMNFSDNMLSGPIPMSFVIGGVLESFSGNPGLCLPTNTHTSGDQIVPPCKTSNNRKKRNYNWVIGILLAIISIGIVLFVKQYFRKNKKPIEHESFSDSIFSYDIKSFHRLTFDQREIIESLIDDNIVGYGGSGTVYRIVLSNGEMVAVKKLWSRKTKYSVPEGKLTIAKELKTEVETLGSIRHKNIVKLYSYFSSVDCSLLIYEYMTNGNLWDALHGGKIHLNWPARYQIALGIAQGLAYLHHDLRPPIIHRDVKSSNILLDVDYQPKVADFGIAKVLQASVGGKESSSSVISGTYGYLAPEYAYSSKATTKCDVYSFGVVLMELITGKKPVEAEFGENKNIVYWISTKLETKEANEVLDKIIAGLFKDYMIKVLRIAVRCTCKSPAHRPNMDEVVQQLIEADPYRFDSCKSFNKTKETFSITKPKNFNDL